MNSEFVDVMLFEAQKNNNQQNYVYEAYKDYSTISLKEICSTLNLSKIIKKESTKKVVEEKVIIKSS